ncbi:MAG: 4-hydroxybutyrate--acetyl-CoA CoA transferase, partial [Alkalispirochaeta sp.]
MANWNAEYGKKLKTMDEAMAALPKKAAVIVGMASMEPQGFMNHLHEYADHFEYLRVMSCLNMSSYEFCENPEFEGTFMNDSWFYGPSNRAAVKAGHKLVDFIPNNLHQAGTQKLRALRDQGVTIVYWGPSTVMQEENGFLNLGVCNVYEKEVIEEADIVVLEVNKNVPRIHGDTNVHLTEVDIVTEYHTPLPQISILDPGPTEKEIGRHIARLVGDGTTLQIGIGGIPNAVAALLDDKKELGIHTEMFTESMIGLFEAGVITNKKKTLWPGKFIFTFA